MDQSIGRSWLGVEICRDPIIVFNKSHSGSRLLTDLLKQAGIFMGSNLNVSNDALDILALVRYLVLEYYPDYSILWKSDNRMSDLFELSRNVIKRHLEARDSKVQPDWGWKLCETTYIIPVIDFLFPNAKYIHLIRDGRDVAFSNHRAPHDVYWKKIYFNTGRIMEWRGLRMNKRAYKRKSHVYNAIHWQNSVLVGRFYGAMLRERYLEVKYEELCSDFTCEARRMFDFLGLSFPSDVVEEVAKTVRTNSIGKYKKQPKQKVNEVVEIIKPLLLSLQYLNNDNVSSGCSPLPSFQSGNEN